MNSQNFEFIGSFNKGIKDDLVNCIIKKLDKIFYENNIDSKDFHFLFFDNDIGSQEKYKYIIFNLVLPNTTSEIVPIYFFWEENESGQFKECYLPNNFPLKKIKDSLVKKQQRIMASDVIIKYISDESFDKDRANIIYNATVKYLQNYKSLYINPINYDSIKKNIFLIYLDLYDNIIDFKKFENYFLDQYSFLVKIEIA